MVSHAPRVTDETPTHEFVGTAMSTTVSVQIVGLHPNAPQLAAAAFDWFQVVESTCSRFDTTSELSRLCAAAPVSTQVSPLLFEVLRVAVAVAAASDGAFDPTLGAALHAMGFDQHWRSGERTDVPSASPLANWRDLALDDSSGAVTLCMPMLLDLGGVAKGFALDLAARAMAAVADCCIVAGGDLLCRGRNARGRPWRTAIVNPLAPTQTAAVLEVDAAEYAVCTSGGYRRATASGHHLLNPRAAAESNSARTVGPTRRSASLLASATVVAPQAAIADALATAAFVLGADAGARLLHDQGVDALLIAPDGTRRTVNGWGRSHFAILAG